VAAIGEIPWRGASAPAARGHGTAQY
jgi:hypothetical protein